MSIKILLVEDEIQLADSLAHVLHKEGYQVEVAYDGNQGWNLTMNHGFDLLILDWMLPHKTGLSICQSLRRFKNISATDDMPKTLADTPVLFLTAKDTLDDRVLGLDAGADDYLIKPFELRELLARVRALLRRSQKIEPPEEETSKKILVMDDLELDLESKLAYRHGRLLKLSEKELKLLEFFLLHSNQLVTQEQIYQYLWSEDQAPSSNVVAAVIRLLRRKIETKGEKALIHTIYGKGYWFGVQENLKRV
ncbi:two component transcriptional regulator, winged helix family [Cyanobacterium stanieri PCC 7202]|uniref:Two component transcriptional regulator, winged helix family n=1 Tax=Cyanobacterium stanieri (strain ATCC 29140 / PCC 7202) TaxID=292563 RepID=K9YJM0_CYASC|nr:two component transcriptional regulator, winged helix family [Cyanobacterium stanieri PCC 7202]